MTQGSTAAHTPATHYPIQRALLSVSDKTGIVELARALTELGIELLATGGTARLLTESGLPVTEVSDYTGFPEMMGGRLKTLHPRIHGGLLGRRGVDDADMITHAIPPIGLVVVNLYPFEEVITRPGCTLEEAIENIDIGGPTLLRAAAKNHAAVTVVVEAGDYEQVLSEIRLQGITTNATRFSLAVKAFAHTARYDGIIAKHLSERGEAFPETLHLQFTKVQDLRYGENPHQRAAFYRDRLPVEPGVASAHQIQGKELSYNNLADVDAALECAKAFEVPVCVIVKHANPCWVAVGDDLLTAYERAYRTDPTSAFGGIIAVNRTLNREVASKILERQFVEVIIAPDIAPDALPILATKKNIRVLACGTWGSDRSRGLDFKRVVGGLLVQDRDLGQIDWKDLRVVTRRTPTEAERADLAFAWKVVKFVKSNAILLARSGMTIGIGAGQMSRVYSARLAALKANDAGLSTQNTVLASDAFFPFRDGLEQAAAMGVSAVIQPGGSVRDAEVIAAANENDIAMVFTDMRHFRH